MKIECLNVNTNKLHDELISLGIIPLLVEGKGDKTWITFDDNVDMTAVQAVIDAHNPEPLPVPPTIEERVTSTETKVVTIEQTLDTVFGGAV